MKFKNQKNFLVVPTPGLTKEQDLAERDRAAKTAYRKIAEAGGLVCVNLHADLDDEHIRRCIARYHGMKVAFVIDQTDSTPEQRDAFRLRWTGVGGPEIQPGQ